MCCSTSVGRLVSPARELILHSQGLTREGPFNVDEEGNATRLLEQASLQSELLSIKRRLDAMEASISELKSERGNPASNAASTESATKRRRKSEVIDLENQQ